MTINIVIDFETKSSCPIEYGPPRYSMDPSTEVLLLAYKIDEAPIVCIDFTQPQNEKMYDLINILQNEKFKLIAHNFWFEYCIWKNVLVKKGGWPEIPDKAWHDTMHQCGMHAIPLSLDKAAKALNLTHKKETGKTLIKLFSVPDKKGELGQPEDYPEQWQEYINYNIGDVQTTYEIFHTLLKYKSKEKSINIPLTLEMNNHGIPVDVESAKIIYEKVLIEQKKYTERLTEMTNGVITKVSQTARMKDWCAEHYGITMPNFTADTVAEYLEEDDLPEEMREILEMRFTGGKSSTSKFEALIKSESEGFVKGVFLYHGAKTGRLVGRGFQPTNLPKPSVKYESMEDLIHDLTTLDNEDLNNKYGSFMKAASTAVRGHIIAPKGNDLYGADYAAIEARLVFWLSDCTKGLKSYHEGKDLYKEIASEVYHTSYENVTDEQRWQGKQIILGCGYGLGWKGFINSCAQWKVEIEKEVAENAINTYRETYFEVPELWKSLNKAALLAVKTGKKAYAAKGKIVFGVMKLPNSQKYLFMKLPSGRLISYPEVIIQDAETPWGETIKAVSYMRLVNNQWVRQSTYGGSLAENACQAISRDIMYQGMENASKAGFHNIMQVYDELISYAPEGFSTIEDFEYLLTHPMPKWAETVPLAAEGKIMKRYQKL